MCTTLNHLGLQYVKRWYKTLHEENMIDARTKVLQKDEKSAEAWIIFCLYQNDKSASFWRASLLYSNFAQLKNYSLVVSSSFLLSFIYCQWGRNQINLAQVCSGPCLKKLKTMYIMILLKGNTRPWIKLCFIHPSNYFTMNNCPIHYSPPNLRVNPDLSTFYSRRPALHMQSQMHMRKIL